MYKYNKNTNSIKFEFDNMEIINENNSQALQDMFVLAALNGKKEGTFLEIGAHDPVNVSNTFLLESAFNWSGISIDILDLANRFSIRPRTKFICHNAITLNYSEVLRNTIEGNRIDYLSLDIEPNYNTLECLKNLPLNDYRFSVITYETDFYDPSQSKELNENVRKESRDILESFGYVLVNGNVSNLDDEHPFEDWWLDSKFFSEEQINKFKRENDNPLAAHKYFIKGF